MIAGDVARTWDLAERVSESVSESESENVTESDTTTAGHATAPPLEGATGPFAAKSQTTMFTIFGARTITLRTVCPSSSSLTRSSAMTAASRSSAEISGSTSIR